MIGKDYLETHWEERRGWRHLFHVLIVAGNKQVDRSLVPEVKLFVSFSQIFLKYLDHFLIPFRFRSSDLSLHLPSYLLANIFLLPEKPVKVSLILHQAQFHILFKHFLNRLN